MATDFTRLKGVAGLARVAGRTADYVNGVLADRAAHYEVFGLTKRNPLHAGERRVVHSADTALKEAQRELLARLEEWVIERKVGHPSGSAHGFIRKRGIVSNARNHLAAPLLLRADIERFFPSIKVVHVQSVLVDRLSLDRGFAVLLTEFLSPTDSLAEGVCASPFLANLVCVNLDADLAALATTSGCVYTRYADDLAFSGASVPTRIQVASACERHGFKLSKRKFRITKPGQAHYVTGLSISDTERPRAPKQFKRRLRQELHFATRFGLDAHLSKAGYSSFQYGINSIDGRLRYLGGIEPLLAKRMKVVWASILAAHGSKPGPTYKSASDIPLPEVHGFVDTTTLPDGRLVMGLVLTTEFAYLEGGARALLEDAKEDPWGGRAGKLESKGLHFADNNLSLQEKYIELLSGLPIKVYVAVAAHDSGGENTYQHLLRVLLKDRATRNTNAQMSVVYEEGDNVTLDQIESVAEEICSEIRARNAAATISIAARKGSKKADICLSSADYALGVFRAYRESGKEFEIARFERLRGKFRLIVDLDSAERWHRNRPFRRGSA